ncbi:transaldolase [Fulvimonas soli]|uniref:Transaldolase n=1 Tax=Fulvimonas soli TaxID=155197 RepID=A0A316HTM3_9GAMM|nr:transaldolase [Fulvimonas soli]PWK83918.1 transaldolase [Fulvimonas soli]TNY25345.1 transaldolase [Fulvimonas soli]
MPTQLEQLRQYTTVVADTGDIDAIARYRPVDATTNPSLLLKAASLPAYAPLLEESLDWARRRGGPRERQVADAGDHLAVAVGRRILELIPGRISTEVDARLSFDTDATVAKAEHLAGLYEQAGIARERILIKIASTWAGIRAAETLQRRGIDCNLTLLFSFAQARACAEAGVFLISPFVGRILDWYVANSGVKQYAPEEDPGVRSVRRIYAYYKRHGYPTVVMGASFRNIGQIQALAGCDRLTISPELLEQLDAAHGELPRVLADDGHRQEPPAPLAEPTFHWEHNEDAMATDKLAEGIRKFAADQRKLEALLMEKL